MQRMQIAGISHCSRYGQVVLEDPDGMVRLPIRMRPIMAHWLAHELKECQCPALSMYRLIQELLVKFAGAQRLTLIDASEDNVPLGLMIICRQNGEEIHQACHPVDAIAMAARTQVPLYATSRALKLSSWKNIQPWLKSIKPQDFQWWQAPKHCIDRLHRCPHRQWGSAEFIAVARCDNALAG